MSDWTTVIFLVIAGFLLLIVEVLFVPGTTVVGVLGLLSTIFGIYLSFDYFGTETGWWFTLGSTMFFALALYISFKNKTWERFSLKDSMKGTVNEGLTLDLKIGDEGVAISTLKPIGKAELNENVFEVRSTGAYVDQGEKIRIIKIEKNNIIVEPIN
jgi:membrane-bound ClpP family serine protease